MHFVGNKAIVMGDGSHDIQLSYSPGYTALSALLPILGLYLGFSAVDRYGKSKQLRHPSLVVTGLTAGLSIMGMHYIGNLGTSNYHLQHNVANMTGTATIAVFDCWFSFTIFFHLRERWMNDWWLRLPCSVLLAAAVSGMHWAAAVETTYSLGVLHKENMGSQDLNVILACVLVSAILYGVECNSNQWHSVQLRCSVACVFSTGPLCASGDWQNEHTK
jgi:NO-binding membrane sensor protein with MHYT domain